MSKYTTELRHILKAGINIFDFDYQFFNDEEKEKLEKEFINHFYFDEIGQETVERFKIMLKDKFTIELPYYAEMVKIDKMEYDILNNYDLKETFTRTSNGENSANSSSNSNGASETKTSNTSSSENNNFNLFANTPQTEVGETFTHASTKSKDKNTTNDTSSTNGNNKNSNTTSSTSSSNFTDNETYENHKIGNIGVQTQSDMLEKHLILQKKLKRIKMMFFEDCEELFMMVY